MADFSGSMSQNQRGERLFPVPARRPCPHSLLRTQIGRGDYPPKPKNWLSPKLYSHPATALRNRVSSLFSFVSIFIFVLSSVCSYLRVSEKGEKEPPFSSPAIKRQEKKKITKHTKRGFEEEPSPGASPLEGHVPHPTKFKVHPNLLHPKTFFK